MRNVLLVQLETKVALAIIAIVIIILMATIFKNFNNFNKFIEQTQSGEQHEEIRLEKSP